MLDLLAEATPSDVQMEPFPHLVLRDCLPGEVVARLIGEFPDVATVTEGKNPGNNQRFSYAAYKSLVDDRVTPLWKDFVQAQLSQTFLNKFLMLFHEPIEQRYPELVSRFGPRLRAGVRRRDPYRHADCMLESQISINSPVTEVTSVRGPHIDMPDKLYAGLFYLRHPDDGSQGGDLQLQRYRRTTECLHGQFIDVNDVETVGTVRYESNVFVLFLNGIDAIHGVTPRELTHYPRMFLNLFGEVERPLFDIARYQRDQSVSNRARHHLLFRKKRLARRLRAFFPSSS